MNLQLVCCTRCGLTVFPARLLCPACGAGAWRNEAATHGHIQEWTVVRARVGVAADGDDGGPVHLASILTDVGPIVIATFDPTQWHDDGALEGARVTLTIDASRRVYAQRAD